MFHYAASTLSSCQLAYLAAEFSRTARGILETRRYQTRIHNTFFKTSYIHAKLWYDLS